MADAARAQIFKGPLQRRMIHLGCYQTHLASALETPWEPPPLIVRIRRAVQRRPRGGAGRRPNRSRCLRRGGSSPGRPAQRDARILGAYLWRLAHLTRSQLDCPAHRGADVQEQAAPEDEQAGEHHRPASRTAVGSSSSLPAN